MLMFNASKAYQHYLVWIELNLDYLFENSLNSSFAKKNNVIKKENLLVMIYQIQQ